MDGDDGYDAIGVGGAGSHRNQREHVETPVHNGGPTAREQWPTGKQNHWPRERKLKPLEPPTKAQRTNYRLSHAASLTGAYSRVVGRIRVLSDNVANKIAAGEVV